MRSGGSRWGTGKGSNPYDPPRDGACPVRGDVLRRIAEKGSYYAYNDWTEPKVSWADNYPPPSMFIPDSKVLRLLRELDLMHCLRVLQQEEVDWQALNALSREELSRMLKIGPAAKIYAALHSTDENYIDDPPQPTNKQRKNNGSQPTSYFVYQPSHPQRHQSPRRVRSRSLGSKRQSQPRTTSEALERLTDDEKRRLYHGAQRLGCRPPKPLRDSIDRFSNAQHGHTTAASSSSTSCNLTNEDLHTLMQLYLQSDELPPAQLLGFTERPIHSMPRPPVSRVSERFSQMTAIWSSTADASHTSTPLPDRPVGVHTSKSAVVANSGAAECNIPRSHTTDSAMVHPHESPPANSMPTQSHPTLPPNQSNQAKQNKDPNVSSHSQAAPPPTPAPASQSLVAPKAKPSTASMSSKPQAPPPSPSTSISSFRLSALHSIDSEAIAYWFSGLPPLPLPRIPIDTSQAMRSTLRGMACTVPTCQNAIAAVCDLLERCQGDNYYAALQAFAMRCLPTSLADISGPLVYANAAALVHASLLHPDLLRVWGYMLAQICPVALPLVMTPSIASLKKYIGDDEDTCCDRLALLMQQVSAVLATELHPSLLPSEATHMAKNGLPVELMGLAWQWIDDILHLPSDHFQSARSIWLTALASLFEGVGHLMEHADHKGFNDMKAATLKLMEKDVGPRSASVAIAIQHLRDRLLLQDSPLQAPEGSMLDPCGTGQAGYDKDQKTHL